MNNKEIPISCAYTLDLESRLSVAKPEEEGKRAYDM